MAVCTQGTLHIALLQVQPHEQVLTVRHACSICATKHSCAACYILLQVQPFWQVLTRYHVSMQPVSVVGQGGHMRMHAAGCNRQAHSLEGPHYGFVAECCAVTLNCRSRRQ